MSWNDNQPDPLDDLLRKANWPEPQHDQIARLELRWRRAVWHRQVRQVAMIAAVIAIPMATLVGFVAIQRRDRDAAIVVAQTPLEAGPIVERREPQAERQMVREPNAFEQAVVLIYRHERGLDQGDFTPAPLPEAAEPDPIAAAIGQLVDNPLLDAAELARELARSTANPQARLVEWCRHGSGKSIDANASASAAQRQGALRLLAHLATSESLPVLSLASTEDDCPPEVLAAIARLAGIEQLAQWSRTERVLQRQQLWMTALLQRGKPQSVAAFLELVGDQATSGAALASARFADKPPVDELFSQLSNSRVAVRHRAARVLGALNDEVVSERLARMALGEVGRREALLALLASSDPVARQFLAYAQSRSDLGPSVRALSAKF